MGKGYKHGGSGGGGFIGLNFEVIASPTLPNNPKENTLWVNSDTPMKSWMFDTKLPISSKYRYIKLQMDALAGSGTTVQFSDIRFVDDKGGFFKYPAGTTISSTIAASSSSENEQKLIDNNANNKFCSGSWVAGSYILIDLGASGAINLEEYKKWQWYTAADSSQYPDRNLKSFSLWGSNDGYRFTLLDSVTGYMIPSQNSAVAYTGTIYEKPEKGPENGDVLFITGKSSNVEFNSLKKNGIKVYPLVAMQYIDGVYVNKPAKIYQNGKWADWIVKIFTLEDGIVIPSTAIARHAGKGVITVSDDGITISYGSEWTGTDVQYYTNVPVDVTNFSSIKLTGLITEMRIGEHFNGFGLIRSLPPADGSWQDQAWVATTEINEISNDPKEYTLNISNITGEYYFLFVAAATKGTITDIRIA